MPPEGFADQGNPAVFPILPVAPKRMYARF